MSDADLPWSLEAVVVIDQRPVVSWSGLSPVSHLPSSPTGIVIAAGAAALAGAPLDFGLAGAPATGPS